MKSTSEVRLPYKPIGWRMTWSRDAKSIWDDGQHASIQAANWYPMRCTLVSEEYAPGESSFTSSLTESWEIIILSTTPPEPCSVNSSRSLYIPLTRGSKSISDLCDSLENGTTSIEKRRG